MLGDLKAPSELHQLCTMILSARKRMQKPLLIDLYCGLGGWAEGFLSEGYECRGFDIEAHDYGTGGYPGELILRDVRSIHGSELKDANCIVGSSPCQEFSYRAMPWKRAKALPPPYLGIELFNAQFRIQREACEASGRYIPLVVENVRGAQKWVGRARWNYGSFYLWGDVPALMPMTLGRREVMKLGIAHRNNGETNFHGFKRTGRTMCYPAGSANPEKVKGRTGKLHWVDESSELYADRDSHGVKQHGSGHIWYKTGNGAMSSKSSARKMASAMIAKIPFPLAQHIARTFKPEEIEAIA